VGSIWRCAASPSRGRRLLPLGRVDHLHLGPQALGLLQQIAQPHQVALVDDGGVIRVAHDAREQLRHRLAVGLFESRLRPRGSST
jgi:hypothetical protein